MNAEIIIAVRGEVEANLRHTVKSIQETAAGAPIVIVYDGAETPMVGIDTVKSYRPWPVPRGCGAARHFGITQSKADVVVIVDGHMDFTVGWLDKILWHHRRNKRDLACCQMRSVGKDFAPLDDKVMTGAFIAYKKAERIDCMQDWHALKGTWNPIGQKTGDIGCVMGACYSFRRTWYDAIGQPLALCDEWGQDEELLSIGTHLMGGRVVCLPVVVGHYYAAPAVNRANQSADAIARRVASRLVVLDAIPMQPEERMDLELFVKQKKRDYGPIEQFRGQRKELALKVRELWASGPVSWSNLQADGIVRPCSELESKQAMGFRVQEDALANEPKQLRFIAPQYRETYVQDPSGQCCLCGHHVRRWNPANGYPGLRKCPHCGHKQRVKR